MNMSEKAAFLKKIARNRVIMNLSYQHIERPLLNQHIVVKNILIKIPEHYGKGCSPYPQCIILFNTNK